jgi:NAD(P)H-hydrate epimerase
MQPPSQLEVVTELPRLPPRPADSNKGTYGRVLILAGSRGMSGAAVLCGGGALRGGAGLVYLAVPDEIQPIVAAANPCYLTAGLPADEGGRLSDRAEPRILALLAGKDVVAAGPGLGQGRAITALVLTLLAQVRVPLVLDADALNALPDYLDCLLGRETPLVLTPHPGEFARLLGCEVPAVQGHREELAVAFAAKHRLVFVLKGHRTIVTDGRRVYHNCTGNPGMATGGTGDVLTGLVAALLGQGLEPFAAAQLAVYLHGRAGDLARDERGEVSLIATDLVEYLPRAICGHHP